MARGLFGGHLPDSPGVKTGAMPGETAKIVGLLIYVPRPRVEPCSCGATGTYAEITGGANGRDVGKVRVAATGIRKRSRELGNR